MEIEIIGNRHETTGKKIIAVTQARNHTTQERLKTDDILHNPVEIKRQDNQVHTITEIDITKVDDTIDKNTGATIDQETTETSIKTRKSKKWQSTKK